MKRWFVISSFVVATTVVSSCAGCEDAAERDGWTLDEPDSDVADDAGVEPTRDSDVPDADDVTVIDLRDAEDDPIRCPVVEPTQVLEASMFPVGRAIAIGGGRLYFQRIGEDGRHQLYSVGPGDENPSPIQKPRDTSVRLLGAAGGELLAHHRPVEGESSVVLMRKDATGNYDSTSVATNFAFPRDMFMSSADGGPFCLIDTLEDRTRIAVALDGVGMSIDVTGDRLGPPMPLGEQLQLAPCVRGEMVAWATKDDDSNDTEVFARFGPSLFERVTENGVFDAAPTTDGDSLFWLSGGVPTVWDAANGMRPLRDGPCGSIHTDGDSAVFACAEPGATGAGTGYLYLGARQLYRYDGEGTELVYTAPEGHWIHAPRIFGQIMVWAEYRDIQPEPAGIFIGEVLAKRGGADPVEVGPITTGCVFCGRYDPPPQIEFDDGILAWTYAFEEDDDPSPPGMGAIGVARLAPCE